MVDVHHRPAGAVQDPSATVGSISPAVTKKGHKGRNAVVGAALLAVGAGGALVANKALSHDKTGTAEGVPGTGAQTVEPQFCRTLGDYLTRMGVTVGRADCNGDLAQDPNLAGEYTVSGTYNGQPVIVSVIQYKNKAEVQPMPGGQTFPVIDKEGNTRAIGLATEGQAQVYLPLRDGRLTDATSQTDGGVLETVYQGPALPTGVYGTNDAGQQEIFGAEVYAALNGGFALHP